MCLIHAEASHAVTQY